MSMSHRIRRAVGLATLLATLGLSANTGMAAAAVTNIHVKQSNVVTTEYFPDDICGPRAGWTTSVSSYKLVVTDLGDSFHATFTEHGTYFTDFDDPASEDYSSSFTGAFEFNLTRGGTTTLTNQWRDFPGTIRIHEHINFVQVGDDILVDRDELSVTGCP